MEDDLFFEGGYSDSTIEDYGSEGDVFEIEPVNGHANVPVEPANGHENLPVEAANEHENFPVEPVYEYENVHIEQANENEIPPIEPANENEILPIEPANENEEMFDLNQLENENPNEHANNIVQIDNGHNEDVIVNDVPVQSVEIDGEHVIEEKEDVIVLQVKSGKRSRESDSEEETDSRNVCPICMDRWTNAGDHRLVCLKCGHLFGNSCILRWLDIGCPAGQRRCPQCNKKASKRDIRTLYVHNLQALDTAEYEKLQEEINLLKHEKVRLEMEIAKVNLNNQLQKEELKKALNKVQKLEMTLKSQPKQSSLPVTQTSSITRMSLENTLEISSAGGCRVLAWNSVMHELYVSLSSANNLFPGFSVRKVIIQESKPVFGQSVLIHSKAIRDLAIRPQSQDLLLSVSLDKTAKLLDLSNNSVVNKFTTNNPLWSCCWDRSNLNRFFVGSQNGTVTQFDSRQPNSPLQQLAFPGDLSAVTSVVSLPFSAERAMLQGGILVCKLVSCWAFAQNSSGTEYHGQQLPLEGPFTSLCHDKETDHILISTRPNQRNTDACHTVCQLHQEGNAITCNTVHSFLAGNVQKQLSRPCLTKVQDDLLVAAHVECRSCINLWNVTSGQIVATVKAHDPVKDICSVYGDDKLHFAALSEKTLRIYRML